MKVEDLRVNNIVRSICHNGLETEIHSIFPYEVKLFANPVCYYELNDIEGISITKDLLMKFGFKDDSLHEKYAEMGPVNCMRLNMLSLSEQEGKWWPVKKYDGIQHLVVGSSIEYIHELQNLYYWIEREELVLIAK